MSLRERTRSSLVQAERLRRDLEDYYSGHQEGDFALAVAAYSRALEVELYARLFEPFLLVGGRFSLSTTGDPATDASVDLLGKFAAGRARLGMGQMAKVLIAAGCRLAMEPHNSFAAHLSRRLVDRETFCCGLFPKQLQKYAQGYRNPATHVDRLSLTRCVKARAYVLEEPTRLLLAADRSEHHRLGPCCRRKGGVNATHPATGVATCGPPPRDISRYQRCPN